MLLQCCKNSVSQGACKLGMGMGGSCLHGSMLRTVIAVLFMRRSTLNAFAIMRQIARVEGPAALWRGLTPRSLWHAPAGAVCWASYEAMKRVLGVNIVHQHDELVLLE